jgi:uncharacterized repeat protein (TIGR01451 family)
MKQKLRLLILLSFTLGFASPKTKVNPNPAIGITLTAYNVGNAIFYNINIKNTGDETLTNVYVTNIDPTNLITFNFSTIASLAPGEEVLNLQGDKFGVFCYDESQIMVHATAASSIPEITDLSSDPLRFDVNGLPGDYYNDFTTITNYYNFIIGQQEGTYFDANNNSIVDVGDVVNYTYYVNSNTGMGVEIFDNNAILAESFFPNGYGNTVGIHYLTAADVALGYVYNSANIIGYGPCDVGGYFYDPSPCACPNPNSASVVTPLTTDLPNQISGKVKFNSANDNCTTGLNFPYRRVDTTDGTYTYSTYANNTGDYHILIPNTGNYATAALTSLSSNFSSNPASVSVTSSGTGIDYNNTNFCISSATNYTDLYVNMFNVNQAIPGNVATYRIYYRNNGSTNLNGSIQVTYNNAKLTFAGAIPSTNSSTPSTLTWNYTNLLPFEERYLELSLNVLIPPTVNVNDVLPFTVVANPTAGDNVPINNTLSWNQTVRSSFDPNDKTVIEGATISTTQATNYLTYVTRFQNTGTANATTVVIKETLDPKLDWNTFEPIASSHTSNIQIKNGNQVTYTFSNIDLPYETANEAASHGWMAYRIKPKSNVVIGDIMSSKSDIYFDYNAPIITNTVNTQVTALGTADFIKNNFKLYPNPAANYLVIEANVSEEAHYQIMDVNGKLLLSDTIESLKPIDISTLQGGFYMVNIITHQGKATYKLIKN